MKRLGDVVFWALWIAASFALYMAALVLIGDWMTDGRSCGRGTACWYDSLDTEKPAVYRFSYSHAGELAVAIVCACAGLIGAIALYGRVGGQRRA